MRRYFQRFRDFAVSENDDIVLGFLDYAAMMHGFRGDFVVGGKAFLQRVEAYLNPLLFENVSEAALRQPAMQRHLTAFKTYLGGITRAGFLALFTATRGFSQTGSGAPTEALFLVR
jgi:hypothetical protein